MAWVRSKCFCTADNCCGQIIKTMQCSSQDFFYRAGEKDRRRGGGGVGEYIVMVHCFSQSVCFLL